MISQNSQSAAAPLVEKLTANNLVARPLSGTPVEVLAACKEPLSLVENADQNGATTDLCQCNTEEHAKALDYLTEIGSNSVRNTLFTAKNVVVPLIQQLVDGYEKYVGDTINGATNNMIVKPVFNHRIWNNPVISSLCEKYDGVPLSKVQLTVKFPSKTTEELQMLVKTGVDKFDKELEDFITNVNGQYGFDLLDDVYKTIFSFESTKGISNLDDAINPFNGNRNAALLTLLLSSRLMVNVPEGMDAALSQYQAYVSAIVEQSGRSVCRIMQVMETEEKNKSLIISYPSIPFGNPYVESVIEVNGNVYNKWLQEGGSPEILFGAYATTTERSYSTLLENKETYLSAWDREKKLIENKLRIEMRTIKSTALRKAFFEVISGLSEEQKRLSNVDMITLADNIIDNMGDGSYGHIYKYARRLVCRGIFPSTDIEDLLIMIDDAAAANPGMEEREAALLATIEYVAGWVASQVKCESF